MQIAPHQVHSLLPKGELTSLLCTEPGARNQFVDALVFSLVRDRRRVVYFDIDSFFTSSVMKSGKLPPKVTLIHPRGEEIDDAFTTLLSWTKPDYALLVIDSATTFYHIYPIGKFSGRNRKLGFYLALLREFVAKTPSPALITSHQIFRKVGKDWITAYSGGRVLDYHSSFVLQASLLGESLYLQVEKGHSKGSSFKVSISQITAILEALRSEKR